MAGLFAPDFVGHDHRLVGWGTSRTAMLDAVRAMVELAPDAQGRTDHLRVSSRGFISDSRWVGTRDGGAFESPYLMVAEFDVRGLVRRADFYDPHHLERALARFAEIEAAAEPDPRELLVEPNTGSALMDRWVEAYHVGADDDWRTMLALFEPGLVFEDRQRMSRVSGDRELALGSLRARVAAGMRPAPKLVGAAGDRVAIFHQHWSGGPPDGRFEIEYLAVMEVGESGLYTAMILFDLYDRRAAQREAWRRWAAIDPAVPPILAVLSEAIDAFDAHDRARLRAVYADDVVAVDHRHASIGRIDGGDAYVDSISVMWDLAPSTRADQGWLMPAIAPHGGVTVIRRYGDVPDGGAFESEYLHLFRVKHGCIAHVELFEMDDLDAALARFEELRPA